MDLKKTTKILKKINRLYDIISDIGEASSTEKDLLNAYIKDMYEAVNEGREEIEELPEPAPKPAKAVKAPAPVIAAPVEEKLDVPEPVASNGAKEKVTAQSKGGISAEMEDLFEKVEISELSDKLSASPISDLTKAMGINEKIFTVKELFGGDQSEFDNMMVALNGVANYGEAKIILMKSVASKYNWDEPAKLKKAKNFIKLIQRRYK